MLVGKKRSSINLSLFTNFSESFSSSSDHGSKSPNFSSTKSPRNFQDRVVGLGIVVAMSDDSHETLRASKTSRGAVAAAAAARSKPIPIISSNPIVKIPKPIVDKEEMELSESYTCVIAHLENGNSVKKREYFDFPDEDNSWGGGGDATGVFFTSPPMKTGMLSVFGDGDFLSSCYLCRKKLLGLDIFMYRGDKAFCSAECRYHQIKSDERKAKRGSGPLKAFDYSVTPCSAPRFVSPGVVAA